MHKKMSFHLNIDCKWHLFFIQKICYYLTGIEAAEDVDSENKENNVFLLECNKLLMFAPGYLT